MEVYHEIVLVSVTARTSSKLFSKRDSCDQPRGLAREKGCLHVLQDVQDDLKILHGESVRPGPVCLLKEAHGFSSQVDAPDGPQDNVSLEATS